MNMPRISGLLFSDVHFPEICWFSYYFLFLLWCPFELRWVRVRSVMFSWVDYDLWHNVPMSLVMRFNFNGPLQVPSKKGVPPDREGSQPTYGPGERRASYVNMKNLAKGRIRIVRKDAEKNVQREKFSQWATSPGAQRCTVLYSQFFR